MKPRRQGFTLLELMIVVAITGVIAALAVPALMHARTAGHEASAVSSLRTLFAVNERYRTRFGVYAGDLAILGAVSNLDPMISGGDKAGYSFTYTGANRSWSCQATPVADQAVRGRYFYLDNTGVIRFDRDADADQTSAPLD